MDNKKRLYLLTGGIAAIILICVLLVGLIDGFWPWQGGNDIDGEYTGMQPAEDDDSKGASGGTTVAGNIDSTETTDSGNLETTEATSGDGDSHTPSNPGSNTGSGSNTDSGSNASSGSDLGTEATENQEPTIDIGTESTEGTGSTDSDSDSSSDSDSGSGSNSDSGSGSGGGISFDDLLELLNGKNGNG